MLDADFEVSRRDFQVSVQLQLDKGARISLLGASGAGKTTILEALAGFVPLARGEIRLGGRLLSQAGGSALGPRLRRVGLVSQGSALFPHLTVMQNICYAPGSDPEVGRARAASLGLQSMLDARPKALSEGERRRVALARALTAGCRLLCLDEPFSALDRPLAEELLGQLLAELDELSVAAILVTHDLEEAQAFANQMAVLRKGVILQTGDSVKLLHQPESTEVARLLGYRGSLVRGEDRIVVHPDLVRAAGAGGLQLEARVVGCRPAGAQFWVEMVVEGGDWLGRMAARWASPLQTGELLSVTVPMTPRFPRGAPWNE